MAYGLSSTVGYFKLGMKNVSVELEQVSNGYIATLEGSARQKKKKPTDSEWVHYQERFVFVNLEDALKEMQGFFKKIDKFLIDNKE